jgi:polar amino acid transport system substrate-binding protein
MSSCSLHPGYFTKKFMAENTLSGHNILNGKLTLFIFIACLLTFLFTHAHAGYDELKSGWYPLEPYQMEAGTGQARHITGLDIQIARELLEKSGYRVSFDPMSWQDIMQGLRTGQADFLMGAYYEEKRLDFVYYSIPYRTERNAVYYHADIKALNSITSREEFFEFLRKEDLRIAVIDEHAYGSKEFENLVQNPPANITLANSDGYIQSLNLTTEGRADLFVSNPIIMDRLLAESGYSSRIKKLGVKGREIPVHIIFSRETISLEQLEKFNTVLGEMKDSGRVRTLHKEFILPAYLGITTGQSWFILLNFLGITAFCTSGVLLARKERYNLFGAIVLATLPAIGGGVLRDLFLGAEQVFVLETPAYFLVAIGVVVLALGIFKVYDYLHDKAGQMTERLGQYTEAQLGGVVDRLFKFFDAWAVASFTVIGVSVAVEMKADPLWLWGPAMGVMTSSGGVVLRDIVRADFNIEMLKQDTYAEISLLGGVVYTFALMFSPYDISLEYIFYLTLSVIAVFFIIRFFILWKGYNNPLQFGAMHTHPQTRLKQFMENEPQLWQLLSSYYTEDESSRAKPVTREALEGLRNNFLYTEGELRGSLDKVAAEPLNDQTVRTYRQCSSRLDIAASVEKNLFSFLELQTGSSAHKSQQAMELQQRIHESLRTMVDTICTAVESGDHLDFSMLEALTSQYRQRFDELRGKYEVELQKKDDPELAGTLRSTHKVERIIYLIGDYVRLRMDKKDLQGGGAPSRKARQVNLLS